MTKRSLQFILVFLLFGAHQDASSQPLRGDFDIDGRVGHSDLFLNLDTWGYPGVIERIFELHEGWNERMTYPPSQPTFSETFFAENTNNVGDDQLVYVDPAGVAHVYWLARDEQLRVQLISSRVYPWGEHSDPKQETFGEGFHNFGGIRLAPSPRPNDGYYLFLRGDGGSIAGRIVFIHFNPSGQRRSEDVIASSRFDYLDAIDAAVDTDGNLHVAAMARAQFQDATETFSYQKVAPDGTPLTDRIAVGHWFGQAGSGSETAHPEVCAIGDGGALVLWDRFESFTAQGVRVDGDTGQIVDSFDLPGAWVAAECHWREGVGTAIAYMKGSVPDNSDFREVLFTVLDDDLMPRFPPVRVSQGDSLADDGAQIYPAGDDYYLAWMQRGRAPSLVRVTTNGAVSAIRTFDTGGTAQELGNADYTRIAVDAEGNAHVVFRTEVYQDTTFVGDRIHYHKTKIEFP